MKDSNNQTDRSSQVSKADFFGNKINDIITNQKLLWGMLTRRQFKTSRQITLFKPVELSLLRIKKRYHHKRIIFTVNENSRKVSKVSEEEKP